MDEMNEKGQRFMLFPNEKYVTGPKCRNLKQLYFLELEEMVEQQCVKDEEHFELEEQGLELTQPVEQMEIFIHALNDSLGYRTLNVIGYHSKKPLHILVDTGSCHNFIDLELIKKNELPYYVDYT